MESNNEQNAQSNTSYRTGSNSTAANQIKKVGAVKLDQGYKSVLRPFRKALQDLFQKNADLYKGRHHWNEDKWFFRVEIFLTNRLKIHNVSERDLAAVILMLYPAFGPSSGQEPEKMVNRHSKIFSLL